MASSMHTKRQRTSASFSESSPSSSAPLPRRSGVADDDNGVASSYTRTGRLSAGAGAAAAGTASDAACCG